MGVARFAALMTVGDDVVGNAFATPIIENEIFPYKFIFQLPLFDLSGVIDDAAFELVHLFKPLVLVVRARLFTADAAGSVHDQFFILLMIRQILFNNIQRIAESIHVGRDGVLKMSDFAFVVVAHIDQDCIGVID